MKKKLISAVLCAALAVTSIASASAANTGETANSGLTFDDFAYPQRVVGEVTQPDNYAVLYKTVQFANSSTSLDFLNPNTGDKVYSSLYFDYNNPVSVYLPDPQGYLCLMNGSGNIYTTYNYNKAGGTYQRIRLKLSKFSDDFNANGTYTKTFFDGEPHDYNFTEEYNGIYSSRLVFISGGAITSTAPDRNGMVEIYVSTNLGDETIYMITCKEGLASGGGTTGTQLCGFTVGDVDKNGSVNLADAAAIQKYTLNPAGTALDDLARRNADVDRNGSINLLDAIKVQKYRLGMA